MSAVRITVLAVVVGLMAGGTALGATLIEVYFDSLATGEIDNGGATLAELNAATSGGTWDLNSGATHQVQADADGSSDKGFSSRAGTATWGAGLDFDRAVDIDKLPDGGLVITFTTGTTDGSGFTRKAHWKLLNGTVSLLDIMLDDGNVEIREGDTGGYTELGYIFAGTDTHCIGTTWDTSSGFLLDFEIRIDNAGNVDVSVSDHGGGGTTDTVTGSVSISDTAEIDRLEMSWEAARASPPMGVYFGEILMTDPSVEGTVLVVK